MTDIKKELRILYGELSELKRRRGWTVTRCAFNRGSEAYAVIELDKEILFLENKILDLEGKLNVKN